MMPRPRDSVLLSMSRPWQIPFLKNPPLRYVNDDDSSGPPRVIVLMVKKPASSEEHVKSFFLVYWFARWDWSTYWWIMNPLVHPSKVTSPSGTPFHHPPPPVSIQEGNIFWQGQSWRFDNQRREEIKDRYDDFRRTFHFWRRITRTMLHHLFVGIRGWRWNMLLPQS